MKGRISCFPNTHFPTIGSLNWDTSVATLTEPTHSVKVDDSVPRDQGLRFMVHGSRCMIQAPGSKVQSKPGSSVSGSKSTVARQALLIIAARTGRASGNIFGVSCGSSSSAPGLGFDG